MSLNKEQTIADLSIEAQILRTIGGIQEIFFSRIKDEGDLESMDRKNSDMYN